VERKEGSMIRPGALVWIGASVIVAIALFFITYRVKHLEEELTSLNQEAVSQEEAIHVLKAEWSYVNRPERLAELAGRYLELKPVAAAQLSAARQLDVPVVPAASATNGEHLQDMLKRITQAGDP